MSYENLVELEDVRVTVPREVLHRLLLHRHVPSADDANAEESICSICQVEYCTGEELMELPCHHQFHKECAHEWLTVYSKNCPICKTDVCGFN
mmetsp:Transcript_7829/g.22300  ORF Transcript_7829/g.22300 Transcript_7829/m.22300 type:complete len:93 (+) Transcript_7829:1305-1583(+)